MTLWCGYYTCCFTNVHFYLRNAPKQSRKSDLPVLDACQFREQSGAAAFIKANLTAQQKDTALYGHASSDINEPSILYVELPFYH